MNSFEVQEFLNGGCAVPFENSDGVSTYWIGWGGSWLSASPEPGKLSVYAPDFFLKDSKPWRVFAHSKKITLTELSELLHHSSSESVIRFAWESPRREDFESMFSDLQVRFGTSELKKAVPVVFARSRGNLGAKGIAGILSRALEAARDFPVNVYGFWNSDEGMVGVTPELLFRQRSRTHFATVSLAGTRPHSASPNERKPLLEDAKEMEEHRFVLDGIESALTNWGSVRVGKTQELRLQKFSHLMTPVEVQTTSPRSFDEIVRALHPTPALGAWPRETGLKWLETLQRFGDRKRFGAPFGAVNESGKGVCWVAIRGVQWQEDRLQLGAGCGVTAKSELQREWQELAIKLESVQAALGI